MPTTRTAGVVTAVLALVAGLLLPLSPAVSHQARRTCQMPDGPAAQAMVRYPSPWPIEFSGPRPGFLAVTNVNAQRITVYLRCGQTNVEVAQTIGHEIGHAVDWTMNSEEDRNRWMRQRGISPRPWFPDWGISDFASPAGDFAEVFAWFHAPRVQFKGRLGPPPPVEPQDYWNTSTTASNSPSPTTTSSSLPPLGEMLGIP